ARPALSHSSVLRIELPLHQLTDNGTAMHFGSLLLVKDMSHTVTEPYLLKRVEQLRRSMIAALEKFDGIRSAPLLSRSSLQFLP
ncbi:MAG: hypothetical protein D3920_09980, partial [Candidatus Electrothrix sp. AW2]|nr:hypothetical protein [Candidatus Electrothrix gigas]